MDPGNSWFVFSVPKKGWASGTTPEPHTTIKHLYKREGYRLPAKSPAVMEPIEIDSPRLESPFGGTSEPPSSSTPCPRSFTPTCQPKGPKKKELPIKVAEIQTKAGYQCKPMDFSRETFVVMKKAREGTQRTSQTRNGVRDSTNKIWNYVTNLPSSGRESVNSTGNLSHRSYYRLYKNWDNILLLFCFDLLENQVSEGIKWLHSDDEAKQCRNSCPLQPLFLWYGNSAHA